MLEHMLENINLIIESSLTDLLPENELKKFVLNGSKRIRSKLALLYIMSNCCIPNDNIYNLLAACELIHNASLLHDDVIDNSDVRREHITIGKKYSQNISILCGDYLVSIAVELLSKINN